METQIINNTYTKIYASGGGNWLTQSFPTNFHVFVRQRYLAAGESADDWKEVTEAEKTKLEQSDAAWVRPEQSLIDEWNEACIIGKKQYGFYNEGTGFFELNELKDITSPDAIRIMQDYNSVTRNVSEVFPRYAFALSKARSIIPLFGTGNGLGGCSLDTTFKYCSEMESIYIVGGNVNSIQSNTFYGCSKLKTLYLYSSYSIVFKGDSLFDNCTKLQNVTITPLSSSINFKNCPLITYESFEHMITKASAQNITITVHPDIFARLTDPDNAEWYALNELALSKNIQFATE